MNDTTMSLPEETMDEAISYLEPDVLLKVTWASTVLRRIAIRYLWRTVDANNVPAQKMLKHILRAFPAVTDRSKASDRITI